MTMTASVDLPPQVEQWLSELCDEKKTGTIQLDIMQGKIEAWRLVLSGRAERPDRKSARRY